MTTSNHKTVFKAFQRHAKDAVLSVARTVALELSESVVLRTPVDTTRAEANWTPALNTIPQDFNEDARNYLGSRPNLDAAKAIAKSIQIGDAFVIANSTPYIIYLEQGSSQQAPAGMVGVTAAMFPRMVERAARQSKNS